VSFRNSKNISVFEQISAVQSSCTYLATYFLGDFLETENCDFPNFKKSSRRQSKGTFGHEAVDDTLYSGLKVAIIFLFVLSLPSLVPSLLYVDAVTVTRHGNA
jgi:hypothetical protein